MCCSASCSKHYIKATNNSATEHVLEALILPYCPPVLLVKTNSEYG